MHQRSRFSASDASYHSFNDIELYEPPSPPKTTRTTTTIALHDDKNDPLPPAAVKMQRQDSGYESHNPTPRTSTSQSRRPSVSRRISSASSHTGGPASSSRGVHRSRPCTRRSTPSYPSPATASPPPLLLVRSAQHADMQHQHLSYFHFPSPEPPSSTSSGGIPTEQPPLSPTSAGVPPQTTHYWTSDNTRRLEYAAIDAASRGIKGWIRRNVVPDCFVSKESRHVSFDDDTGSVRRYRLELEDDGADGDEVSEKRSRSNGRRRWAFWLSRKSTL
ncbi:hypothetical protein S40285_04971 [Stachybotrys chlorohalonatus IBT 40285]|uniref:Uncharacterized protein n=1 Tax=Stachybotrys chlorohalonatus (strain IBT 40285) TaxID=1283841 RepID=A0A084QUL1_STAC4|nr:hypothetical protein S40285_04971 [Stachybotrys chlorohalonata IBT 40285]